MRTLPCLIALAVTSAGGFAEESDPAASFEAFEPNAHAVQRYEHIWHRSPFVVETKIVEESAGLAQRFALTGVGVIGDAPFAFLLDRNSGQRVMVSNKANQHNLELVSVDHQSDVRNSSAVIRQGGEQASLRFEREFLTTMAATSEAVPGVPGTNQQLPASDGTPNASVETSAQPVNTAPARVIRRTLIRTRE